MEADRSFAEGVKVAQELELGDRSFARRRRLGFHCENLRPGERTYGMHLTPADVRREGIRDLSTRVLQSARAKVSLTN